MVEAETAQSRGECLNSVRVGKERELARRLARCCSMVDEG
jgi:hypothetical protein